MEAKKKGRLLVILSIFAALILLILSIFLLRSCEQRRIQEGIKNFESDLYYLDPRIGYAELVDVESIGQPQINTSAIATENCQPQAHLLIKKTSLSQSPELSPVSYQLELKPYVLPAELTTDPPSPGIQVLTPEAGQQLVAGSAFLLKWTIDSGRELSVDVLFSSDGGQTYREVKKGISNQNELEMILPDVDSTNCIFRINVWVGSAFLGYNQSETFSLISAPSQSEPEPDEDAQSQTDDSTLPDDNESTNQDQPPKTVIDPNLYSPDDGVMIALSGDGLRSFWISHDFANVDHLLWQLASSPMTCDQESGRIPGLIASGLLPAGVESFDLDFAAIFAAAQGQESVQNQGTDFSLAPDLILTNQSQQVIYLRVILYDQSNQPLAGTGSGFQLIVGQAAIDLSLPVVQSPYPPPVLSAKTQPGFDSGTFEELPDQGLFLMNNGQYQRSLMLSGIPGDSVEIDLQLASQPFENETITDFTQPAGLIYRDQQMGLTYTTVTRFYNLDFLDIAPQLASLGSGTVRYYLRAVCYVPGQTPGTVIPVATKKGSIVFTGDPKVYFAGTFDPADQPPEEVVVKSYVPNTEFLRYIPAAWALPDADEYFEVTRPIQAEEICFYIKNSKNGDFLYPYEMHMALYPQTTREDYQEVVDRMLPVGAWFHLSITQSGWDAFWSDFFELLSQIYQSIATAYADLKVTIANTVADRFAFLGQEMQSYIRRAVTGLIDYGLVSVGLPPTLPNFEALADEGLDYCVRVALEETARSMDIPVDQIPADLRSAITDEVSAQLDGLAQMKNVNPFNVTYLKPATQAHYRPAYVDVKLFNQHDQRSPTGSLMIAYYPPDKPHFKIYDTTSLKIPSLGPGESTFIRIYLSPGSTELPVYQDYYQGDTGQCQLVVRAQYDVIDLESAAAQQNATGTNSLMPDVYVYDIDPLYEFKAINTPAQELFN